MPSMPGTWKFPRHTLEQGEEVWNQIRKEWHNDAEGINIPPPRYAIPSRHFNSLGPDGDERPTPIQKQRLTVALARQDMIGIAFTGSGKTLSFSFPLVMAALQEDFKLPLMVGVGTTWAPTREFSRQTFDATDVFCGFLSTTPGYPELQPQYSLEENRSETKTLPCTVIVSIVTAPGSLRDVSKQNRGNWKMVVYLFR